MHCPRALSVVVAVVIQSVCAVAQDTSSRTEPSSETATLPPVVVSATRGGPRSAEDLPVSVTVISREEIEASPGITIDEILRTTPGIQLQLTNSNTILPIIPSISMRGLGLGDNGTRTLVLVDGLPANGAFFGNVFWNRVPKQNVERIEIVRGSGSAQFGTYALGGRGQYRHAASAGSTPGGGGSRLWNATDLSRQSLWGHTDNRRAAHESQCQLL